MQKEIKMEGGNQEKAKEGERERSCETRKEEDITIVNIYTPNKGAPQYIRQMLTAIKGEIDSDTIIVENFNTPLSPMDRSSKMKINKKKLKKKKRKLE